MDQENTFIIDQEELEETLSFCDLPIGNVQELDDDDYRSLSFHQPPNSPSHEHFEFPLIPNTSLNGKNDIVFCGKHIKKEQGFVDDQIRYSTNLFNNNKKDLGSLCSVNSKPNSSLSIKSLRSQSFSVSSCSSSSRKHKVLIGLVKIPPKMELSDIKKRQSRRNPSPMFPSLADVGLKEVADGCGSGGDGSGSRRGGNRWSLLRPLRCRAYFCSALAKTTLGCIPRV